jgi:protein-disulfide isomerase/uncharacterized membrane protein
MDQKVSGISGWWKRRSQKITLRVPPPGEPYFVGRLPFVFLLVFTLVGIFATGFLTYRHVVLETHSGVVGDSLLCKAEGKINCDEVLISQYSYLFGFISSAALGLTGFSFVLWVTINCLFVDRIRKMGWVCLLVYFFAAIGFSWYYIYIMAFEVDHICTWCIVVHATNFVSIFFVIAVAIRKRDNFLLIETATRSERFYFVFGGMLASVIILLGAGLVEKVLSFNNLKTNYEEIANDPVVIMAMLRSSPTYRIPISDEDPVFGATDAPHKLIFFSDLECPVCARKEQELRKLVAANEGTIALVYKSYPLSTSCNSNLLGNLHPNACEAARAAYAAFLMGGPKAFWDYSDLILENQKKLKSSSWIVFAEKLKLDPVKFGDFMQPDSPAGQKVKQDVALGATLKITGTPQVFFEGKRIPENFKGQMFIDALEELVGNTHPEKKNFRLNRVFLSYVTENVQ